MSNITFAERLHQRTVETGRANVVGLDPDFNLMPAWFTQRYARPCSEALLDYCKLVIDAIYNVVPVVKPQSAYFEVFGGRGVEALEETVAYAKDKGLLVLLDAKRGDIGSTSAAYARAYLSPAGSISVDALTVNPYLGPDSMGPFVEAAYEFNRGLFICTMTSNPGAKYLQGLACERQPLYRHVASMVGSLIAASSDRYSPVGIVAGATYPDEARVLRDQLPRSIFLVPGVGSQGGDLELLKYFFDNDGGGAIVSSSRAILYPKDTSNDEFQLSELIRNATIALGAQVNSQRGGADA